MWSSDSDRDESVSTTTTAASSPSPSSSLQPQTPPPPRRRRNRNRRRQQKRRSTNGAEGEDSDDESPQADAEQVWCGVQWEAAWPRRAKPVVLAGEERSPAGTGSAGAGDPGVGRARSLTDDDLEELKGCVDLGFGFSYNEIPELCGTLPALELCYSMSQRFLDEHHSPAKPEQVAPEPPAQTIPNWKISCPGDSPDEVKARLKYWAQAVACTVKLCS